MNPLTFLESKGIDISKDGYYKLKAESFMDLIVEIWHNGKIANISMAHYGKQNGDLMKDPDILFETLDGKIKFREYSNDYAHVYTDVQAGKMCVNDEWIDKSVDYLTNDITVFMKTWIENLNNQGHEIIEKEIEN